MPNSNKQNDAQHLEVFSREGTTEDIPFREGNCHSEKGRRGLWDRGKHLGKSTRWNERGVSGNSGCVTPVLAAALDRYIVIDQHSHREMRLTGPRWRGDSEGRVPVTPSLFPQWPGLQLNSMHLDSSSHSPQDVCMRGEGGRGKVSL